LKGAAMNKPKEKWWTVTKFDVGRGLANPDYVQWADERIAALEAEVAKFTPTNSESVKLPSETLLLLKCAFFETCPVSGKGHAGCYSEAPCFKR
jgi:hypothetical protein